MSGPIVLTILVLIAATALAILGVITGEAWIGLVVGTLLVSPVTAAVKARR